MNKNHTHNSYPSGFTIVELLIVIVIIGILAAITIVAYNGVQDRAHAASAQADANSVTKLLTMANTTNGSFPADLSTINNGGPLPTSDGTTYAYHPGSSNTSYCATVTNGRSSYKVTDTAIVPVAGGCPGDGVGGVAAITNLAANPSAETNTNSFAPDTASPTLAKSTAFAYAGSASLLGTSTVTSPDVSIRFDATLAPGLYRFSYMVYSPVARSNVYFDFAAPSGNNSNSNGMTSVPANTWTKITGTFNVGGASTTSAQLYMHNAGGPNASGQQVYIDALMLTSGSTQYNYADGNTSGWLWNGTANNSASTGPPQ